jgi:hypothetical protein
VRNLRYGNVLVVLLLLGCSSGSNQSPTTPGPGGVPGVPVGSGAGTGIFVAGCNFSNLDQNYAYDIVVSGSDTVVGQGQKLGATVYSRSGSIQGEFTVNVVPGSTGSSLLETIQSANDGGASFKVEISNTVSTSQNAAMSGAYAANLIHASLADGSQINGRSLLCKAGQ